MSRIVLLVVSSTLFLAACQSGQDALTERADHKEAAVAAPCIEAMNLSEEADAKATEVEAALRDVDDRESSQVEAIDDEERQEPGGIFGLNQDPDVYERRHAEYEARIQAVRDAAAAERTALEDALTEVRAQAGLKLDLCYRLPTDTPVPISCVQALERIGYKDRAYQIAANQCRAASGQ